LTVATAAVSRKKSQKRVDSLLNFKCKKLFSFEGGGNFSLLH
jgi:hypothetical protein